MCVNVKIKKTLDNADGSANDFHTYDFCVIHNQKVNYDSLMKH